jgi:TetR/AcrR family transcriptional regulator, regulator of biofilm formation and stress response
MVTRAQLAQGRSRQRRDELLAAAIELFAEGGSRAVTHRAVARTAGLPPATTTYYFASIEDLLREALAAHMQQWRTDLENLTRLDPGELGVGLDDGTTLVSQVFNQRTPEVARLQLSIFLAASQDPALRDTATEALRSFEQLAARVLSRLGVEKPEALAAAVIALIAGSALRRQSDQYSDQEEARILTTAIRGLIAAHLLGDEKVTRALKG